MQRIRILLVEDNEGDILLTQEAFEDLDLNVDLEVVRDGEKAIQFIYKEGNYADVSTPDLVLLDINLPKLSGFDVLKKMKQDRTIRKIPVIMLTTSSSVSDVNRAYRNFANCYIVKPDNADKLVETVQVIENFWVGISQLPTN